MAKGPAAGKKTANAGNVQEGDALTVITSIESESRTILSVVGVLFGFLLNVSLFSNNSLDAMEQLLLTASLVCSVLTVGIFALPVIYHHIEFPYRDPKKFLLRYHWFISVGFIPFIFTFFFSTALAFHKVLGETYTFILTAVLFVIIAIVYALRRVGK